MRHKPNSVYFRNFTFTFLSLLSCITDWLHITLLKRGSGSPSRKTVRQTARQTLGSLHCIRVKSNSKATLGT